MPLGCPEVSPLEDESKAPSFRVGALAPQGGELGDLPTSLLAVAYRSRKEWAQGQSLR